MNFFIHTNFLGDLNQAEDKINLGTVISNESAQFSDII